MTSIFKLFAFLVWFMVLMFSQFSTLLIVQARKRGFTIELIHRESPLSPFYNASDTNSNRLKNSVLRSKSYIDHFHFSSSQPNSIQSEVSSNRGNYLMKYSIGTPPVEVLSAVDTGSDLIWTQCEPCVQCYRQDTPLFNSQQSSTYKETSCDSNYCQALESSGGNAPCAGNPNTHCEYGYAYVDGSKTFGSVATETFTFDSSTGQSVSIPNIVFGCGKINSGTFNGHGSGIFGLGGGPLSLISQLSSQIGGKFSYCLLPMFSRDTSKLKFGDEAAATIEGMVSTPLISNKGSGTNYYLTLEGISIGSQRLDMPMTNNNAGNIIIDSGTTLTYIPSDSYTQLESAVKQAINFNAVPDPTGIFPFCYNTNELMVPKMTFHFTGADMLWDPRNTFVPQAGLLCFTVVPSKGQTYLGNIAQINFLVEYDLQGKKVSFAPTDCTKS